MTGQAAAYQSTDPVDNLTLADMNRVRTFGDSLGLTCKVGAVSINRAPDPTEIYYDDLGKVQQAGVQPGDPIRYVCEFDAYPGAVHDMGYLLRTLTNQDWQYDQRLRQYAADVAETLSNNNAHADQTQQTVLDKIMSNPTSVVNPTAGLNKAFAVFTPGNPL